MTIDESWYVRPASGVKDRTSAGGVVLRRDETGRVWFAVAREGSLRILPKGGVKRRESLLEGARREIQEEAGFTDLTLLASLGSRERLDYGRTRWITTHYFLFLTEETAPRPTDGRHAYVAEWFPLNGELPEMFWPEQAALLETERGRMLQLVHGESTMFNERTRAYMVHGLSATPVVLEELLAGITEAELDRRPDPERFTIREAVAHLADWEEVWRERMIAMRDTNHPTLPGYDEGQWAIDHDYAHADIVREVAKFREARARTAAFLSALSGAQWERPGAHAEAGEMTIGTLAALVLGHDGYHLRQIIEWKKAAS